MKKKHIFNVVLLVFAGILGLLIGEVLKHDLIIGMLFLLLTIFVQIARLQHYYEERDE